MPRAREIALAWIKHGMDACFLRYLVTTVREEAGVRQERVHDSRIRRNIESAAQHLEKARLALIRIDRLAFVAEPVGGAVLDYIHQHITAAKAPRSS